MTDRIKGLTVSLEKDIREDDVQPIVDAIIMIRGIADVKLHVTNPDDYMARKQVKEELRSMIFEWFKKL